MSAHIKVLIQMLQESTSQKNTYNTLLQVHSTIINSKEDLKYFIESSGLNTITQFLSQPNEKILNVSLGILAEGCSDIECSKKVVSEGIIKKITTIMRYINQDRIHYRCCKIFGNLASHLNFCSVLISNCTYELMIPVLKGQPSVGTQFIIFRSMRYMWSGASLQEKKNIVRSEIFENTFRYLESENKSVQKSVLRLLLYASRFRSDVFLKQLIKGGVLSKFVSLTPEYSNIIFRILYYLSEIKFLHFELAKAGVVEVLLSHVRKLNSRELETRKESDMDLVLRSLHRLCGEPKCRERLCHMPGAFDTLLGIIENSSFTKFKKYSVLILTSFMYDERSLKTLVEQRLILAVINYLQTVIEDEGVPHGKDEMKNETVILSSSPTSSGRFSPMSDSEMSFAYSASPNSERSAPSPASSLDSVYSPVCSPAADDIDEDADGIEEPSADECSSVAESPLPFQENDSIKSLAEEKIFNLLKQLTFGQEPIYDLCAQRTWDTLLDYLVLVGKTPNHLACLLSAIAANKFFFQQLLQSQFPLIVHKKLCRPVHIECNHCLEINKYGNEILTRYQEVAESTYGNEVLRNEITKRNTSADKTLLALTIPHIVQNVTRLEEYLLRYKTLQLIMGSLNEEVDDDRSLFQEKVACLCSLANDVYLESPRTALCLCKKCDVGSLTKEATISFLLDDGSTVTANKRTICEKSEFFEGMFRCGFKEAKESVVRLSNISSDCLTVLIRLLYSYCDCIIPKNVVVLLELIVQSDRFLIPDLSKQLLNITMNCILDYKNCHIIYDWAIENGSFLPSTNQWPIRHDVLKHVLVEKLTFNQRVHSVRMLLKSKYKSNVLTDINEIIECQLTSKDVKTKSSLKYIKTTAAKRRKLCY